MKRLLRTPHQRPRPDAGMTLVEILVASIVMAMVASVMVGAIAVVLRTNPTTQSTADAAVNAQSLVAFLPPDVDSTAPGSYDTNSATASGCSGTDAGRNVLHLSWTEELFATTTYVANYRYVDDGTDGRIVRYACSGVGTLGAPSIIAMTSTLALWDTSDPPVVVTLRNSDGQTVTECGCASTFLAERVDVSLKTETGDEVFIEGASKNPGETLPPVTTTAPATTAAATTTTTTTTTTVVGPTTTVAGPTTTTTTTTTIPACIVNSMTISPSSVKLQNTTQSRLKDDVDVEITLDATGYCVGLTLQYDTGGSNGQYLQNFAPGSPSTVTLLGHPTGNENWTVGPHTLEVKDGTGSVLASGTLTVTS